MKKTIVMILLLLLTSVWSIVCAGLQDKQSLVVVSSTEVSLCTPTLLPIADYEFEFPRTDTTTNLLLEYFDMLQCTTQQTNLLILPSSVVPAPTYDTICSGETYTWNGNVYDTSNTYTLTLSNQQGCDSTATLVLTVLPKSVTQTENAIIGSDKLPYLWRGQSLYATGEYTDTLYYDVAHCDSVIHVLNLTVLTTGATDEQTATICDTELPYQWYNQEYHTTGQYTYTEKYAGTDIDSIQHILQLTINPTIRIDETITACDSYTWNSETYTESGNYTYTTTAANGCDSITTLHLTINKTIYEEETVTACDSYYWNGETYTTSGDYTYTTTAANGCDSITTLHLTINKTVYKEVTVTACDSYYWNGETYTTSGNYTYTTTAANGCDSITTLHLTINYSEIGTTEYATICYGESYTWNGNTYNASDTYTITLSNTLGCDSTATLVLTILPAAVTETESVTIGSDQLPYLWREQSHTTTGQYTDIEQYIAAACDSAIYVLNLTVLSTGATDEQTVTICDTELPYHWYNEEYTTTGRYTYTEKYAGTDIDSIQHILQLTINYRDTAFFTVTECDSYEWHGEEYTESGTYYYNTQTVLGCDSVEVLNLTINYSDTAFFTQTACDSYEWHDQVYNTSGTYYYHTQTMLGCDSVEVLNLTINYRDTAFFTKTACDSYEWHGEEYTESGTYYYNTQTMLGCDSVEVLNLTINYRDTTFFTKTACDSYEWHGEEYTESGTYYYNTQTMLGCDSVEVLNLTINYRDTAFFTKTACDSYTWHNQVYNTSGIYYYNTQTMLGCDSVEVLNLTINYRDTAFFTKTACDSYEWHGEEYTESGTYYYNTQTIHGCDSVEVMRLTILPPTKYFATDTALCYGEVCDWRGVIYKESGIYHDTIRNILHCDSLIYTLNLVIYPEIPITHIIDTIAGAEYHWNDQIYTHGGDYTVTLPAITGCDSMVILHLVDNHAAIDTVIVYEQCAGSGEQEVEILTQGYIEQIVLNYSPQAQAAGLRDTVMMLSSTDDIYTIYYDDVRAGVHEVRAVGLFHGKEVASYPFTLTYLYPNTIFEQRYNDLIAVLTHDYNGGYDFTAFQWYKDGVLLPGETHSYLNQSLSFENEYSVLLTNTDGLQLMSCPIIAEDKAELSVYPTILKHGEMVKCHMTDENMLFIHNSTGKIIQEQPLKEGTTAITLPAISGVYLLRFVSNDHIERTFKVIVQ